MQAYSLKDYIEDCRQVVRDEHTAAHSVELIVPLMYRLLSGDTSFLKPEHYRSDPDHYARNAIFIDDTGLLSLYALVWSPGQWTPVHDHSTWGVVGVLEGVLEERNFMRQDSAAKKSSESIELVRSGVIMLPPNAVTSFVPNPDHIHITGNPSADQRVVSLHLYGNAMAGFNVYDTDANTRKWIEVSHNES